MSEQPTRHFRSRQFNFKVCQDPWALRRRLTLPLIVSSSLLLQITRRPFILHNQPLSFFQRHIYRDGRILEGLFKK